MNATKLLAAQLLLSFRSLKIQCRSTEKDVLLPNQRTVKINATKLFSTQHLEWSGQHLDKKISSKKMHVHISTFAFEMDCSRYFLLQNFSI